MVDRGDILLPDPATFHVPSLADYLRELTLFTGVNDAHDDEVDATTQLLNYVRGLGSFNVDDLWRRQADQTDALRWHPSLHCGRRSISSVKTTAARAKASCAKLA
jgi:hypothetical protein